MTNNCTQEFQILIDSTHACAEVDVRYRDQADPCVVGEEALEGAWQAQLKVSPGDTNNRLLRVHSYGATPTGMELSLSNTDYRQYIGTRCPKLAKSSGRWKLANPLSVCLVAETRDGQLLIEERSAQSAYPGRIHVIGGFVERDTDAPQGVPDPGFAIQREAAEEVGLAAEFDSLRVLGLAYDCVLPHPELLYCGRLDVDLAHLKQLAKETGGTEFNRVGSVAADADELARFLTENASNIVPTGRAALLLFGKLRFGPEWASQQGFSSF